LLLRFTRHFDKIAEWPVRRRKKARRPRFNQGHAGCFISGGEGVRIDSFPAFPEKSNNRLPLNALRSAFSPTPSPEIR
jgi:hypothetical protein